MVPIPAAAGLVKASTPETVTLLARVLCVCTESDEHKALFGTTAVRDALVSMARHATSADSVEWLSGVISNVCVDPNNRLMFATVPVRDAVVSMLVHARGRATATECTT